jgi:hypothetical protein
MRRVQTCELIRLSNPDLNETVLTASPAYENVDIGL